MKNSGHSGTASEPHLAPKTIEVHVRIPIPAGSYRELLAYPLIALLLLPGVYWIFIDQSVWAWDESWYGMVSVDLWYALIHEPARWFGEMLRAFVWETGTRAPGIAWFGQFFVPMGQLLGSIETGLLLWIILAQFISLIMLFQIGRALFPKTISQSIVGVLIAASAPLFVALGHLFYVEPIQMLGVTYFYWIAVRSAKWDRITIITHLLSAISISMLAKASSPLYCVFPGIFVVYQLMRCDKWNDSSSLFNLYWKISLLVASCPLFLVTVMWYVRNIGPLYSFVVSTTTGEIANHYGQKEEFLGKLQYWLSAVQKSFFTPEMLIIIGITLLATLGVWIARQKTKISLTKWNSQLTIVLIALLQTAVPIIVFSTQILENSRLMLPILPSFIILILGILSLNPSRAITTALIVSLSLQWLYVNGVSLGKLSPNYKISHWIRVPDTDTRKKNEIESTIKIINNRQNQWHFNMVGMSLPWLNHRNLSFYSSKDRLSSGYRTYFVELGYFEKSEENAWNRLNEFKTSYFVTLEEDMQPNPPDDLNLVSLPILKRVRNDKRFVPVQFASDIGLIIFRNQTQVQTQEPSLVTQEIRYHMPEAGEVFLVWGINGWQVVSEEIRPAGTVLTENEVMRTPMAREDGTFVVRVQVPAGTRLDYGFGIEKTRSGAAIGWVWDGDYRLIPSEEDGVIEVKATVTLPQDQAFVSAADVPVVTQEICYHVPEASKVFLVWGINGWVLVPEEHRPAGTVVKDSIMYTPMVREGDTFIAKVQVPAGATVDYVFQMIRARRGAVIEVWDANGDPKQDYHTVAVQGGVAEVQAPPSLRKQIAVRDLDIALPWLGIIFLAGVCAISSAIGVHRRFTIGASRNHFLLHIKKIIWKKRFLLIMSFISVLYLAAINTDLYTWGDNAHYIIVGKSIATGQGFRDIHHPEKPPFQFPIPVFPLLLSPFIYFFDYNLLPMKIFVSIMGIGAIYLVYRLFRDLLDDSLTILLMLFVGVSPHIVSFSHQVMTEVPYLVFSMLSLLCVMKYGSEERWLTRTGFISALVIAVTCLTKPIGIALVLASIPYLLLVSAANKFQGVKKVCLLISVCASVWILSNYTTITDNPYIGWFLRGSSGNSSIISAGPEALVARIFTNLKAYGRAVPETILYCTSKAPSVILAILSLFLLGYGFFYCLLKRKTILEYYILSYFFILLPVEPSGRLNVQRYVVPIIPFLLYYFMQGLRQLGFWISRFGRSQDDYFAVRNPVAALKSAFGNTQNIASAFICILILLNLNSVLQASILRTRIEIFEYYVFDDWVKYNNMALWMKEHTPPESTVITTKAYNFHILSHRAVYWYPYIDPDADKEEILRTILRMNADYIALDAFKLRSIEGRAIADTIQQNQDMFQLVYQDGHNKIYHIRRRISHNEHTGHLPRGAGNGTRP